MGRVPKKLRDECAADPFYYTCARFEALHDHECKPDPLTGRLIEWEHALIFAGKQVQKKFALVPLCWYVHRGPGLNKSVNEWIALNRATSVDLLELSRPGGLNYGLHRAYLNKKFGPYQPTPSPENPTGIHYFSRV